MLREQHCSHIQFHIDVEELVSWRRVRLDNTRIIKDLSVESKHSCDYWPFQHVKCIERTSLAILNGIPTCSTVRFTFLDGCHWCWHHFTIILLSHCNASDFFFVMCDAATILGQTISTSATISLFKYTPTRNHINNDICTGLAIEAMHASRCA